MFACISIIVSRLKAALFCFLTRWKHSEHFYYTVSYCNALNNLYIPAGNMHVQEVAHLACFQYFLFVDFFIRSFHIKRTYYLDVNLNLFSLRFSTIICRSISDPLKLSGTSVAGNRIQPLNVVLSQTRYTMCSHCTIDILHVHSGEPDIHFKLVSDITSRLNFWYCDKTYHNTTFISLNAASLNVIVCKHKSFKT